MLIDSWADESLMDATIASELGIPSQPLSVPMDDRALDGCSIGAFTHSTLPVQLRVSCNHSETIQFLLIASPHVPVVFKFSWLFLEPILPFPLPSSSTTFLNLSSLGC